MTNDQMSLVGAARLDAAGVFEVYLGNGKDSPRKPCVSECLRQYTRELFDFLMSNEAQRQVGDLMLLKRRTSTGRTMVQAPFLDRFYIRLIRGEGEYSTFVLGLPFLGQAEALDRSDYNDEEAFVNEEGEVF